MSSTALYQYKYTLYICASLVTGYTRPLCVDIVIKYISYCYVMNRIMKMYSQVIGPIKWKIPRNIESNVCQLTYLIHVSPPINIITCA